MQDLNNIYTNSCTIVFMDAIMILVIVLLVNCNLTVIKWLSLDFCDLNYDGNNKNILMIIIIKLNQGLQYL